MKESTQDAAASAFELISTHVTELNGWRGEMLACLRAVIRTADPDMAEEQKWNMSVWSHHGLICTGEAYKQVVKMMFAKDAFMPDLPGLLNSSLDGNMYRVINFCEGNKVNKKALKALIQAAIAVNEACAKC